MLPRPRLWTRPLLRLRCSPSVGSKLSLQTVRLTSPFWPSSFSSTLTLFSAPYSYHALPISCDAPLSVLCSRLTFPHHSVPAFYSSFSGLAVADNTSIRWRGYPFCTLDLHTFVFREPMAPQFPLCASLLRWFASLAGGPTDYCQVPPPSFLHGHVFLPEYPLSCTLLYSPYSLLLTSLAPLPSSTSLEQAICTHSSCAYPAVQAVPSPSSRSWGAPHSFTLLYYIGLLLLWSPPSSMLPLSCPAFSPPICAFIHANIESFFNYRYVVLIVCTINLIHIMWRRLHSLMLQNLWATATYLMLQSPYSRHRRFRTYCHRLRHSYCHLSYVHYLSLSSLLFFSGQPLSLHPATLALYNLHLSIAASRSATRRIRMFCTQLHHSPYSYCYIRSWLSLHLLHLAQLTCLVALLLLCGDIHPHPGPPHSGPPVSASAITIID